MQVPADAGGIVPGSQRVLQALDQVTEVVEGLKDLCTLVLHRQVHHWLILCDRKWLKAFCNSFKKKQTAKRNLLITNLRPEWGV